MILRNQRFNILHSLVTRWCSFQIRHTWLKNKTGHLATSFTISAGIEFNTCFNLPPLVPIKSTQSEKRGNFAPLAPQDHPIPAGLTNSDHIAGGVKT
jgi:hypothetical protein